MSKVEIQEVGNVGSNPTSATTAINENFERLQTSLENTLSRDGTTPNQLEANLDLNSKRITNLGSPAAPTDAARLTDITGSATLPELAIPSQVGNAGKVLATNGSTLLFGDSSLVGELLNPQTDAEAALDLDVVDFSIPSHERIGVIIPNRYKVNTTPGTTDMTDAIQDSIDLGATLGAVGRRGGVVQLLSEDYGTTGVTLAEGVYLSGMRLSRGSNGGSWLVALAGSAAQLVITPATENGGCGAVGVGFRGLGAGTALIGMRIRVSHWATVKNCFFSNFADEALITDADSISTVVSENLAYGCLLDRTRSDKSGVFDIGGTDCTVEKNELTASTNAEGTLTSVDARCCALVVRGSYNKFKGNILEISDVGCYVAPGTEGNRFEEDRADQTYGNGWEIHGGGQWHNVLALRIGLDADNTYDGFKATGASNVKMVGCRVESLDGAGGEARHRHGYSDDQASDANKNKYIGCDSLGHGTRTWNTSGTSGAAIVVPDGPLKTLSAGDTTPSVDNYGSFATNNSGATTITTFDDGVDGQVIMLLATDSNTTIQHNGSTIFTPTANNVKLTINHVYLFKKTAGAWRLLNVSPVQTASNYADDAAAATGGIPVGGVYHNAGAVRVRLT